MEIVKNFFMSSFKRGIFWGTADLIFKAVALLVYAFVLVTVIYMLYRAIVYEFNPQTRTWWLGYCLLSLLSATALLYTALFVRRGEEDLYDD
ncbi:hypothetical protein Dip518_000212 [Parelusimicrobium proximum]|uniref:hypothetical protein n=1 Tax=Parelusimicrobium proximum TaxID=3228953 RepID=UPI003D1753C7